MVEQAAASNEDPRRTEFFETEINRSSGVLPSNARLIEGLRQTLSEIAGEVHGRARQSLQSADIVLNELMLRTDHEFFARLYEQLYSLAREGAAMTHNNLPSVATNFSALESPTTLELNYDLLAGRIHQALEVIECIVQALPSRGESAADTYRARALELESAFYSHRTQQVRSTPVSGHPLPSKEQFEDYLRGRNTDPETRVIAFDELIGGYQKTTVMVETEEGVGNRRRMVIRAEKDRPFLMLDAGKVAAEFELLQILHGAGLPVAKPLWVEEDSSVFGNPFMVSERLPGASLGSAIAAADMTEEVAREIVEILARIHATPLDGRIRSSAIGHWLDHGSLAANTRANVEAWRNQIYMPFAESSIELNCMCDWLVENVPKDEAPARLLHVDYGPHNMLIDGGRVSGVVDWESARIGDPAEDLSYMMSNFQGKFERDKVIAWYNAASEDEISEYRLRYFDVFANLKLLVGPMSAAAYFEKNRNASIDWCVLALLYSAISRGTKNKMDLAEAARGQ